MSELPAGLATISVAMDDSPQVRGAIDMAQRLRRAEALSDLADMDADLIGADAVPDRAIQDHAALVIRAAYRSQDTRAIVFRQGGVEVVR